MAAKPAIKPRQPANFVDLYLVKSSHFGPLQQPGEPGSLTDAQEMRARLMSKNRAREYRLSRWLLHKALSRTLPAADTDKIDIIDQTDLPPWSPQAAAAGLHFSISHSGGYVAVAVSTQGEIGLDMEFTGKSRSFLEVARQYFSSAERSLIAEADSSGTPASLFYLLWTQKEAYLKLRALGLGAIPMSDICFKPIGSHNNSYDFKSEQYCIASCIIFNHLQFSVVSRTLTGVKLIAVNNQKEDAELYFEDAKISRYIYDDSAAV